MDLFIKDRSSGAVYEVPYTALEWTEELNVGKSARATFDYQAVNNLVSTFGFSPKFLFAAGFREFYIEKDGTRVYDGVVSEYGKTRSADQNIPLTVASVGFFSLLDRRRTAQVRTFELVDAGLIAWTLIDESQDSDLPYSDLGITQGTIELSKNRDRTFKFDSVKDAIYKLSNKNLLNGFDCDIDNDRKFNVFYPLKGQLRPEIVFDDHNILSWSYKVPLLLSMANRVYAVGGEIGGDQIVATRNSPDDYKTSFTLLEDVDSARDVSETDTLEDHGDRMLEDKQSPKPKLTITALDNDPDILNYELGDWVRVKLSEPEISDVYMRLIKRTVKVDANQQTVVTLELEG